MMSPNVRTKLSLFTTLLMLLQLFIFVTPGMASETIGSVDKYKTKGPQYMPLRPDLLNQKGLPEGPVMKSFGSNMGSTFTSKANDNINPKLPDGSIKPKMSPAPELDQSGRLLVPQIGTKKSVAIMVYFENDPFEPGIDQNYFNDMLFNDTPGANSMHNYYKEQSYGQLNIDGIVLGPYKSDYNIDYYAQDTATNNNGIDDANVQIYELARESVQKAVYDNPDFNWDDYDQDSDGFIDNVIIIQAGPGQEEGAPANKSIWSHQSAIPGGEPVGDGLKVANYTMQPETGKIGVFAHEYGHVLGLPDLYDVSYTITGAGEWELMASGSWNNNGETPAGLSAWSKHYLGWLNYTEPNEDLKDLVLQNTVDYPEALRLWTNGQGSNTYYLVENRQKKGYDSFLPGEGLLVWWIDNPERFVDYNRVNVQVPTCMPVEADGNYNLWSSGLLQSNSGDAGDPFPGSTNNTAFTFTSTPNATTYDLLNPNNWEVSGLWDGLYTGVSLWNIQAQDPSANIKTYKFDTTVKNGILLTPRTSLSQSSLTLGQSINLEYVLLNDNTVVNIYVVDGNGSLVRNLITSNTENKGIHSISWDGKKNNGSYVSAGNYKIRIETSVTSTNTKNPLGGGSSFERTATSSHELAIQVTSNNTGSIGGGGGGGGGGISTDSSKESIIGDFEFNEAVSESKETGRVEISTSGKEVRLNEKQLKRVVETNKPMALSVNNVGIVLSNQLVQRLLEIGNASFTVEPVTVNQAQSIMAQADNRNQFKLVDNIYEITISAGKKEFTFKDDETVTAELPVPASARKLAGQGKLTVGYYNPTEKKWEDMNATYNEKKNTMAFTTSHFSKYAVLEKTAQADVMRKPAVIKLTLGQVEAQLNGYKYSLDAKPFLDTEVNRTLVPVRFVSEALGCKVDWIAKDKKVEIKKGNNVVVLTLGSKEVLVNGRKSIMDCAPNIMPPGRTFVPLRFISETLGAKVQYDQATQSITITE